MSRKIRYIVAEYKYIIGCTDSVEIMEFTSRRAAEAYIREAAAAYKGMYPGSYTKNYLRPDGILRVFRKHDRDFSIGFYVTDLRKWESI